MEALNIAESHPVLPRSSVYSKSLPLRRKGADRGFVVEAGVHSIAALNVELDEVDVNVDLAKKAVLL